MPNKAWQALLINIMKRSISSR